MDHARQPLVEKWWNEVWPLITHASEGRGTQNNFEKTGHNGKIGARSANEGGFCYEGGLPLFAARASRVAAGGLSTYVPSPLNHEQWVTHFRSGSPTTISTQILYPKLPNLGSQAQFGPPTSEVGRPLQSHDEWSARGAFTVFLCGFYVFQ